MSSGVDKSVLLGIIIGIHGDADVDVITLIVNLISVGFVSLLENNLGERIKKSVIIHW